MQVISMAQQMASSSSTNNNRVSKADASSTETWAHGIRAKLLVSPETLHHSYSRCWVYQASRWCCQVIIVVWGTNTSKQWFCYWANSVFWTFLPWNRCFENGDPCVDQAMASIQTPCRFCTWWVASTGLEHGFLAVDRSWPTRDKIMGCSSGSNPPPPPMSVSGEKGIQGHLPLMDKCVVFSRLYPFTTSQWCAAQWCQYHWSVLSCAWGISWDSPPPGWDGNMLVKGLTPPVCNALDSRAKICASFTGKCAVIDLPVDELCVPAREGGGHLSFLPAQACWAPPAMACGVASTRSKRQASGQEALLHLFLCFYLARCVPLARPALLRWVLGWECQWMLPAFAAFSLQSWSLSTAVVGDEAPI